MLDDHLELKKWNNERRIEAVAKRKADIEAAAQAKRNELLKKEKREMSPIRQKMMKTFNASSSTSVITKMNQKSRA